jgi:hypothetical protein
VVSFKKSGGGNALLQLMERAWTPALFQIGKSCVGASDLSQRGRRS